MFIYFFLDALWAVQKTWKYAGYICTALGSDTSLRLSPTLGPTLHPLLRPLTLCLDRLDDHKLLPSLRSLNISTWADLTTRAPDGTRSRLDIASLHPALTLPGFPPTTRPWPGDLDASRPGQFWRLTLGHDEWAWGGIYQILCAHPDSGELTTQRWSALPAGLNRPRPLIRTGFPVKITYADFMSRGTHRLLVTLTTDKGHIHAEFPVPPPPPHPGRTPSVTLSRGNIHGPSIRTLVGAPYTLHLHRRSSVYTAPMKVGGPYSYRRIPQTCALTLPGSGSRFPLLCRPSVARHMWWNY